MTPLCVTIGGRVIVLGDYSDDELRKLRDAADEMLQRRAWRAPDIDFEIRAFSTE